MIRSADLFFASVAVLSVSQMVSPRGSLAADAESSYSGREHALQIIALPSPPTALTSDHAGRLLAAVPGDTGGLFVVDPWRNETRLFISGNVSSVAGSRDGKLFVATAEAILQVDLEAGWTITDVSAQFACSNQSERTANGTRDGSVWISGCAMFRDASGEYLPCPEGLDGSEALMASAYDLYDNHWALGTGQDGAAVVAVRAAGTPDRWQRVDAQPQEDVRLLAIDASGFAWVSNPDGSALRRMAPRAPDAGWQAFDGAADWTGSATAIRRSTLDGDILIGFDDGTLLEAEAAVESDSENLRLTTRPIAGAGEVGGPIDLIHVDPRGHIWLTSGSQVFRIEAAADAWQHFWEEVTPLPGGNHDIFAVELDRRLYVAGGLAAGWDYPAEERVFAEIFRYDPSDRTWSVAGEMPSARCHNGLTILDGEIWIVGGRANPDKPDSARGLDPLDEVIVFDPAKGTWRQEPPLNTARTEPVALVSGGRVYAIGGSDTAEGNSLSSVESIAPGEDAWRFEAQTPRAIRQFAGCVLDDVLYVVGEEGAFAYDPGKGEWDDLPAPEHLPQASYVAAFEGEIWVLGDHHSKKSWRYSPAERIWRSGPDLPTPQSWGGAAVLEGRLYVVGGAHWSTRMGWHIWDDRVFVLRPDWRSTGSTE